MTQTQAWLLIIEGAPIALYFTIRLLLMMFGGSAHRVP